MELLRLPLRYWFGLGVALILVSGWAIAPHFMKPQVVASSEIDRLLDRLESECDPLSLTNNYDGTTEAQPTEKVRGELLARMRPFGLSGLRAVQVRLMAKPGDEFGEMLVLVAAMLGDDSKVEEAAQMMVWSGHPAVRLCAARELQKLRDPRTVEWFESALRDDRFVLNGDCGLSREPYYPVRVVAELALRDLRQMPEADR